MLCSVIILNWNGEAMLRRYLPSVLAHTPQEDIEIVVADNGSTDGSVDYIRTQSVRLVSLDKNYGFAEGYNRAIAQSDAEYVVLLNSDVEVTEGWLERLIAYMRSHPDVVGVQPKILSWQSKEAFQRGEESAVRFEHAGAAGGMIDVLGYPYCRGRMLSYIEDDYGQYDEESSIFWASGACLLVRREVYQAVGGLDGFFFAHQEEIDWCWRVQCRGYRLACVPESVVYHLGAGTLSYESPRKTYLNFRNNLLMLYKNLPAPKLYMVLFVRFFMDYVAAIQMLFCGKVENAKAVWQARCDFRKARKRYKPVRKANLRAATIAYPDTISRRSIIFDYYVLRRRK